MHLKSNPPPIDVAGLAPLECDRFWADQERAIADPFGRDIPQMPCGLVVTGHEFAVQPECVFAELGVDADFWRLHTDPDWCVALCRAYNDRAEAILGRRVLPEAPLHPRLAFPIWKLHDVFECESVWMTDSWWLKESAHTEDELTALLDRVDARIADLRSFLLPENWDEEKARLQALGAKIPPYRFQRGPVTLATSVFGIENLIFLILGNPGLAARFRDAILAAMLAIGDLVDAEAGLTPATAPRGFQFNDDNCYLLSPDMYEFFAEPILRGVFERFSPGPADRRAQHSDSAMGHLLPILGRLGVNWTNFGPTVMIDEIRRHLPKAEIWGELAPFALMNNDASLIVEQCRRDIAMAREGRGVVLTTAGSVNNGTRLASLRLVMSTLQREGRY
jgi:uroporphyrinogen decarboxylase